MLRTGIALLMICVICATDISADDATAQKSRTLMEWLRSGKHWPRSTASVRPATVNESTEPAPDAGQSSYTLVADQPQPGTEPLNPLPIQMAPVIPDESTVSGQQFLSVSNPQQISEPVSPGRNRQQYQASVPVSQNSPGIYSMASRRVVSTPVKNDGGNTPEASPSGAPLQPGTALYPSPVHRVPQQVGGTAVMSQFLNPHEMLYAHHYRAMYPPYSYKVNGKWMVTPFGVWSHEDWYLQGTQVDVKYKSSISPFALFTPRRVR